MNRDFLMSYRAQNSVIRLLALLLANADKSDVEVFKTSVFFFVSIHY